MKKKIYNVFLVAFLMLSIVACGKSKVDIEVVVGQAEDLIESRLDGSGYIATSRYDEEENIFIVTMSLDVGDLSTSSENDEIGNAVMSIMDRQEEHIEEILGQIEELVISNFNSFDLEVEVETYYVDMDGNKTEY